MSILIIHGSTNFFYFHGNIFVKNITHYTYMCNSTEKTDCLKRSLFLGPWSIRTRKHAPTAEQSPDEPDETPRKYA